MEKIPSLRELRETRVLKLPVETINIRVSSLKNSRIDFDVVLGSGRRLQRDFCWNLDQKQELIMSILIGRFIPRMSVVMHRDDSYSVIDGKQRLSTVLQFVADGFPVNIDGVELLFSQLPEDYQTAITKKDLGFYIVNEIDRVVSDLEKMNWFAYINFAGTAMSDEHLNEVRDMIKQESRH